MMRPNALAVIPCYNHGRFVGEAVASVLAQEDADVEVVVVNDGSDDDSTAAACDACAGDRVRVVHQANTGLPGARNRGVREGSSETEYVFFLDADDYIEPTFVTRLHEALAGSADDVSHAYCQERLVERHEGVWAVPEWDPVLCMVTNLHPVTALVRRSCFDAVGGFDETMTEGYEDWDLWLRFIDRGWRGVRVREPLFNWRRHSEQTMIIEAGHRHERLFARLVENHSALYRKHADELLLRSNQLLRTGEANWIDEEGQAIVLRDTRRYVSFLESERARLEGEIERLEGCLCEAECEAKRIIACYEEKPVVRASRAFYRVVDAMPAPLASLSRSLVNGLKRVAPGARG